MGRGGLRPGSGRTAIVGREIKIKLSDDVFEQLELNFTGKTDQERIRECLEYGIKSKIQIYLHRNIMFWIYFLVQVDYHVVLWMQILMLY